MTTSLRLTDTQLVLLSRASQREDGLLVPLGTLRGGAARAVATGLLRAKLVAEVPVARDAPHWFGDDEAAHWTGLQITVAGLEAIGVDGSSRVGAADAEAETESASPGTAADQPCRAPTGPREGTKRALVIELLGRPQGASLDELVSATGWLPHTTRAALTGLRQRGYGLIRGEDESGSSRYRISHDLPSSDADRQVSAGVGGVGSVEA